MPSSPLSPDEVRYKYGYQLQIGDFVKVWFCQVGFSELVDIIDHPGNMTLAMWADAEHKPRIGSFQTPRFHEPQEMTIEPEARYEVLEGGWLAEG